MLVSSYLLKQGYFHVVRNDHILYELMHKFHRGLRVGSCGMRPCKRDPIYLRRGGQRALAPMAPVPPYPYDRVEYAERVDPILQGVSLELGVEQWDVE